MCHAPPSKDERLLLHPTWGLGGTHANLALPPSQDPLMVSQAAQWEVRVSTEAPLCVLTFLANWFAKTIWRVKDPAAWFHDRNGTVVQNFLSA